MHLIAIGGGSGSIGTATLVTVHASHSRDAASLLILTSFKARIDVESESSIVPISGL